MLIPQSLDGLCESSTNANSEFSVRQQSGKFLVPNDTREGFDELRQVRRSLLTADATGHVLFRCLTVTASAAMARPRHRSRPFGKFVSSLVKLTTVPSLGTNIRIVSTCCQATVEIVQANVTTVKTLSRLSRTSSKHSGINNSRYGTARFL